MSFSQVEIDSLSKLKTSSFLGILGSVMVVVYSVTYYLVFLPITLAYRGEVHPSPGMLRFQLIPDIVIELVAGAIQLLIFYYARQGFKGLSTINIPTKNGVTGATILIVFAIIGLLIGVPLILFFEFVELPFLLSAPPASSIPSPTLVLFAVLALVLLVFALVGFAGLILVIISEYSLGNRYGEGLIKLGSILQIIPFLDFVGYILLYFGFSNAINKVRSGFQIPQQVQQPPQQVYQVGFGSLSASGLARFTLYSPKSVAITSAVLGLFNQQVRAQSIYPSILSPGQNVIEVNFGPLQLTKGSYFVDLTLGDGSALRVYVIL
ncbi:DUF973 family protein [Metallosphaera javensis (ex Sakai et al. 2022)]|uniref:DUF973 family protein n=1 Tax=Metallosphaera javensis (ex Sakai et al. 2022) TaxID=2775498 RepID=UPI00258749E5|nr:MAG: hypothetical protein MjAS7_1733 [Metallosphaera javensis (ex Sakai et al. 2022)]